MAVDSKAHTTWNGSLTEGSGRTSLDSSGAAELDVTWAARSEGSDSTTTPEELIAAAHSSCFSMALSAALSKNGTPPTSLNVSAKVTFVPGTGITGSAIAVEGDVPGIDQAAFTEFAEGAKANCPVSQALAGVEITLASATLV